MNWWCCCQVIYIIVRLLRKNFFLRFRCHGLHRRLAKRAQSSLCGKGRVDCVVFLPDQLENFNTPPHSSLDRDWRCATSSRTRPAFSRRSCAVPALFDALLLYEASLSILLPTTLSAAIYDRIPKYLRRAVISSPGPRGPLNWLPCVERKGSRYIPHATKSVKKSARSEENWEHPPMCRILDLWYQHLQSLTSQHLGV